MFYTNCGSEIPAQNNFCSNCGAAVSQRVRLRCRECYGTMDVYPNQQILVCPYCDSKELILDSDWVRVERMKNETYKDFQKMKFERDIQKDDLYMEKEEINAFKKGDFSKALIIFAIICAVLFIIRINRDGWDKLGGIIALIQCILFIISWLMGAKIIKKEKYEYYVIVAIVGYSLFIPFFMTPTNFSLKHRARTSARSEEYNEIQWPDSEIAKLVPVPESNIGEIISDSEDGFYIYISKTSRKDYNAYVEGCKDKGFTVDYSRSDDFYSANDKKGFRLSLSYDDDEQVMCINLDKPK